ncbi:MAG TPA: HigA family addiction module antitoxin [Tepidisphaeraceae bacterium]|nr:HigA family addiction module antitoxin [Tepidisphaeraceae bacterium]
MKPFKPAEVFHPGEFLREELEARRWSQRDFARIIGRPLQVVNRIIRAKKRVTAETAKEIGLALGTGPEVWINLQSCYDLWSTADPDPGIARRAREFAQSGG